MRDIHGVLTSVPHDTRYSVPSVPLSSTTRKPTLGINPQAWQTLVTARGLITEQRQADALGISRQHLSAVRNGHYAPGAEFLARVFVAFPEADIRALFPVREKAVA